MRNTYLIILTLVLINACTNTNELTATQISPSITSTAMFPASTSTPEPESVAPTVTESVAAP